MNAITTVGIIQVRLTQSVTVAESVTKKLSETVLKSPDDALYAISWLEDRVIVIAQGSYAAETLSFVEKFKAGGMSEVDAWKKALSGIIIRMEESLLRNELRGSSCSAFSNATEAARREALARDLENYRYSLKSLEKETQ